MKLHTQEEWDAIRSNMSDAIDHLNVLVGQAADAFAESMRGWHARSAGLPPLTVNNFKGSAGDPVIGMIKKENGYRVQAWSGVGAYEYDVGPDGRYPHNHPRYSIDLAGLLGRAIAASLAPDPRAEKVEALEPVHEAGDYLTVREAAEALRSLHGRTGPIDDSDKPLGVHDAAVDILDYAKHAGSTDEAVGYAMAVIRREIVKHVDAVLPFEAEEPAPPLIDDRVRAEELVQKIWSINDIGKAAEAVLERFADVKERVPEIRTAKPVLRFPDHANAWLVEQFCDHYCSEHPAADIDGIIVQHALTHVFGMGNLYPVDAIEEDDEAEVARMHKAGAKRETVIKPSTVVDERGKIVAPMLVGNTTFHIGVDADAVLAAAARRKAATWWNKS